MTANIPPGTVIAQGHNNTVDARTIVTHTTNVTVSVEDRARILAEVGAALRPVLEGLHERITRLEGDNRALRDTLEALTGSVPARKPALTPAVEDTTIDVGSDPEEAADADPWSAETP